MPIRICCYSHLVFVGFLCGKCDKDSNEGMALDLIECVSCKGWHIGMFVIICKLVTFMPLVLTMYIRSTINYMCSYIATCTKGPYEQIHTL